jgi:3-mercaptopyruvate sulfurtransferase SseA
VALQLRRQGISRVRPLAGGLEAWIAADFPLEAIPTEALPAQELKA